MIGSWLAGTYESPGDLLRDEAGRPYKESFGMASKRAVSARTRGDGGFDRARKAPVRGGHLRRRGSCSTRSGPAWRTCSTASAPACARACTYAGARTLDELHERAVVGVQTLAGFTEGTPHGL